MPYYNIISEKYRMILSVQPKCGCSTIKEWIQQQNGNQKLEGQYINDQQVLSSAYDRYERILIVRNLYDRLISYYSLFVIDGRYKDQWIHADEDKKLSLAEKSFRDFISILKDLPRKNYQHHLLPQTHGIDIQSYDLILNIKEFNNFLKKRKLPAAKIINRLPRHDYQQSVINLLPIQFQKNKIPAGANFQEDKLIEITRKYIYPTDFSLLKEYLQ